MSGSLVIHKRVCKGKWVHVSMTAPRVGMLRGGLINGCASCTMVRATQRYALLATSMLRCDVATATPEQKPPFLRKCKSCN